VKTFLNKHIIKSEFGVNVATLMTGTVIAQALTIAVSPLLTRIYTPEDFGVFGLYIAIVSIVSVIAAGRYELAIMLPKTNEEAINTLSLSIILSFATSIVLLVTLLLFQNSIIDYLLGKYPHINSGEIRIWLLLTPASVLLIALYQIFNYWSTRQKTFKRNAAARIGQAGTNSLTALSVGYLSSNSLGLIYGNVIGYFTAFVLLFRKAFRELKLLLPFVNKKRIKEQAVRYKLFPLVNTPHAFLGGMQEQGIVFVITYFFQLSALGFYSFTNRIMHIPVIVIGSSMYQVFYQKASQMFNDGLSIRPVLFQMYKKSAIIALPVFIIIFFTAPTVFSFIFGSEWRYAGEIAQIMVPWLFLNFIASPVSSLPLITSNQKKAMVIAVVDFSLRITALIIGGITGSFKTALFIMSASCSLVLIYALIWFYQLSDNIKSEEVR